MYVCLLLGPPSHCPIPSIQISTEHLTEPVPCRFPHQLSIFHTWQCIYISSQLPCAHFEIETHSVLLVHGFTVSELISRLLRGMAQTSLPAHPKEKRFTEGRTFSGALPSLLAGFSLFFYHVYSASADKVPQGHKLIYLHILKFYFLNSPKSKFIPGHLSNSGNAMITSSGHGIFVSQSQTVLIILT